MQGLAFLPPRTAPRESAPRGDIAAFVGLGHWRAGAAAPPRAFDNWEAFEQAMDWRARALPGGGQADTALGLAVRDFFANGGQRCQVLLAGPAPAVGAAVPPQRFEQLLAALEPLRHLEEAALLLLPDLPDLAANDLQPLAPADTPPEPPERFVECAPRLAPSPTPGLLRLSAARLDDEGYARWRAMAEQIGFWLARQRRDMMALLALPLPGPRARASRDPLAATAALDSSFLQLAYPWLAPLQPPRSAEGLVAPDGALAGLVAASCRASGVQHSAAGRAPRGVYRLEPLPQPAWAQRLSCFWPQPGGIELLSDRTLSGRVGWQAAANGRLLGQLLRLARRLGETLVFEGNGPRLWRQVELRFERLLGRLWAQGALRGAQAADAFSVRCDRGTMTQNDLDAGRLVCRVAFAPALSLSRIEVELLLSEAGGLAWRDVAELPELAELSP